MSFISCMLQSNFQHLLEISGSRVGMETHGVGKGVGMVSSLCNMQL